MIKRRNRNEESHEIPDYLNISGGKYYSKRNHSASRPSDHKTRKEFPELKYGLSSDTPTEFQTKFSFYNMSSRTKLHNESAVTGEVRKDVLPKEKITQWPMRSIQTTDVNMTAVPHKFETKSVKAKEVYNCVLDTKKVVQRPDMVVKEETLYTKRYYEALAESKAFNRKTGYLGLFARHHKTTNQEYKIKRSNSNEHNRYISKPVIFTSMLSKNDMSHHVSQNHSQVLISAKDSSVNISQKRIEEAPVVSQPTFEATTQISKILPQNTSVNEQKTQEPGLRQSISLERNLVPRESQQVPQGIPPRRSSMQIESGRASQVSNVGEIRLPAIAATSSSAHQASILKFSESTFEKTDVMNVSLVKPKGTVTFEVQRGRVSHVVPELVRFRTKKVSRAITSTRERAIKDDPEHIESRTQETVNNRVCNIEASVAEERRKYAKTHNGKEVRYLSAPPERPNHSQTQVLNDNISRFEKHIDGMKRTQVQFGRQRWFYQKNWKPKFVEDNS